MRDRLPAPLVGAAALATLFVLAACTPPEPGPGRLPAVLPALQLPSTLTVPGDYSTPTAALAAAVAGDVVSLGAGTFVGDLTVPGGVILQGAGLEATFISGHVTVLGGQAAIRFVTVQGPGLGSLSCGISAGAGDSVELVASRLRNFWQGVCLDPGTSIAVPWPVIDRVTFRANGYGVTVSSGQVSVTNSYFEYQRRSGLHGFNGATVLAINNTFVANAFGGNAGDRDAGISLGEDGASVVRNNLVISNLFGMQCDGCSVTSGTNDVWGNTTNYAGDAAAASTDLSVDPMLVGFAAGNFRLQAGSPLIDQGSSEGAPGSDWDGMPRPAGAGWDIGADEWSLSDFTLVINEVMANPVVESTGEFIEIANVGSVPVDLDGLVISDGDSTDTIQAMGGGSTIVPAGGHAVVLDPGYAANYTLPAGAITVTVGNPTLGNSLSTNDPIQLWEADGYVLIDEWTLPFDPGDGSSAERIDVLAGNVPSNWVTSPCASGSSPGALNCAAGSIVPNDPSVLVLTEVLSNAVNEQTGEFVELWNSGTLSVNVGGLVISDGDSSDGLVGWGGTDTILPAGAYALIVDPNYTGQYLVPNGVLMLTTSDATIGNGLANGSDPVTLYDLDGATVIDSWSFPTDPGDGVSIEKVDLATGDIGSNWAASSCASGHSAGRLACVAGGLGSGLILNEVLNNPIDEQTGEFIELSNLGSVPVDLAGLWISDGDQTEPLVTWSGGTTVLAAGARALIIDSGYAGNFTIPAGTVVMTTTDNHLGNGLSVSDPISVLEIDGASVIDTWWAPFNPGNGTSVEKVAGPVGDLAGNWQPCTCANGASPGLPNCVSSATASSGSTSLVLSEVMANPLNEGTGEYVEVFNDGTTSLDLAGLVLDDGDGYDVIVPRVGTSVVPAGAYAVVVDADYAAQYTIPAGVTVVTVNSATLGSGLATNDSVTLYEADGYTVIDSYSYPFDPGNGTSVERIDLATADLAVNWAASPCGQSPGAANCAGAAITACSDGVDNDGDGWIDLVDPGCATTADTNESMVGSDDCGDEVDNDGDGLVDGFDPDCATPTGDSEAGGCANGTDDDGDGWIDLDDPDCPSVAGEVGLSSAQCNDGVDNDGDGAVDAADPDCADGATISESSGCSDGADNDGDGWADSADPDCASQPYLETGLGTSGCNDGLDNNGDGLIDGADPECYSAYYQEPLPYFWMVVSEVMVDPQAVSDANGEWFELYNPLAVTVDLQGWTIYDGGGDNHTISGSLVFPAGGYLVFGNNGNPSTNGGVSVDYVYSGIQMDNVDDEIYIDDPTGTEVFQMEYWINNGWPIASGSSMSLTGATPPLLGTNGVASWCPSTVAWSGSAGDAGSPGVANEICP